MLSFTGRYRAAPLTLPPCCGEHDFGALEVQSERLFFKIDYYDQALSAHSLDQADQSVTKCVLTIMLAEEY